MNERISGRISAHLRANVVGYVGVFIALTLAPAFAASDRAPKNSVVSKSIKDGQVRTADLAADAVSTEKIAPGAVTSPKLADNSVSVAKLGFNPVTDSQLDSFGNSLASPGTINDAGNPVDWTRLKGVPTGLADGSDADSGGTVTSVATGAGLAGGTITDAGTISLTSCPSGQVLKSTGPSYSCAADDFARATTETASAIPSVANGITVLFVDYASATVISDLTGSVDGQRVTLVSADANPSISDGGNFRLAANWTGGTDDTLTLVRRGSLWYEVARSSN